MKNIFIKIIAVLIGCIPLLANSYNDGPIKVSSVLQTISKQELFPQISEPITGLGYSQKSRKFVFNTLKWNIYLTNEKFTNIIKKARMDALFSIDLAKSVSSSFLNDETILTTGYNKSYSVIKEDDKANAKKGFAYFYEGADIFSSVKRNRFATLRAKMNYILSLAYDAKNDTIMTLSVPNKQNEKLILSRFDNSDKKIQQEAIVTTNLISDQKLLSKYYITGAFVYGNFLYALSKHFSSILEINLQNSKVTNVFGVDKLKDPQALAIKDDMFYIIDRDDKKNFLHIVKMQ